MMKISSVRNLNFRGTWQNENPRTVNTFVENFRVNHIYTQRQVYHPFADEKVPTKVLELEGVKGYEYLEYDSQDDNFGAEHKSIAIQQTVVGSKLDITEEQYKELLAQKIAGEQAARKLSTYGNKNWTPMRLPMSAGHDTTSCAQDIGSVNAQIYAREYNLLA
ncbi:MAG: hypothetical protein IJ003_06070 [Candidatus Gastranaerophilales bacterium]|nr:hypothetical protein [Candidatus Gastranaerophilales bacterium]